MARRTRQTTASGGSPARTGAPRGLARPRFDFRCATCGHTLAAFSAPDECPLCYGSVWEQRTVASDPSRTPEAERVASLSALAAKVIGSNQVRRWRFEQLQRAGYPVGEAFALSGFGHVDLHQAIGLIRDRCPIPTAMQILV